MPTPTAARSPSSSASSTRCRGCSTRPGWSLAGSSPERFGSVQRGVGPHLTVVTGLPRADRWVEVRAGVVEHLARGGPRARPGGRRHRLQPRAGRHARVRLPAGPQPDDPGRARGGRRDRRGRQRRPGRFVPAGPGAGRAARPDRRRPRARRGQPDAADARLVREGRRGHGRGVHPARPGCTSSPRTGPASTRRSWPAAPSSRSGDSALGSALAGSSTRWRPASAPRGRPRSAQAANSR